MGCTAKHRSPFNDCGKLCDWLDCFGAHFFFFFCMDSCLVKSVLVRINCISGFFFIHRAFDWHRRCCFEIFNTFYKSLEALLVFPLPPHSPPHPLLPLGRSFKNLIRSKNFEISDVFEASIWGTLQICRVIKTWWNLPPGLNHTPPASMFTHMNALWVMVERHSKLGPRRELLSSHSWSPEESSAV